jgi:hypothetical protein
MLNLDASNSHTLTKQHASETVLNSTESAATDMELNISRADSTHNEPGSEPAAEILPTLSDWQQKWIHRFNIVADSVKLEETLTEFIVEAKTAHEGTRDTPHTDTRWAKATATTTVSPSTAEATWTTKGTILCSLCLAHPETVPLFTDPSHSRGYRSRADIMHNLPGRAPRTLLSYLPGRTAYRPENADGSTPTHRM